MIAIWFVIVVFLFSEIIMLDGWTDKNGPSRWKEVERDKSTFLLWNNYDSIIKVWEKGCRNNSRSKLNHIYELARCLSVNSTCLSIIKQYSNSKPGLLCSGSPLWWISLILSSYINCGFILNGDCNQIPLWIISLRLQFQLKYTTIPPLVCKWGGSLYMYLSHNKSKGVVTIIFIHILFNYHKSAGGGL